MRTLWPMPITLDVSEAIVQSLDGAEKVALRDQTGLLLAILTIEDIWQPDKAREAQDVFGTTNPEHPAVGYLMHEAGVYYIGGTLDVRFRADIARRLRGEPAYTVPPPAKLPEPEQPDG